MAITAYNHGILGVLRAKKTKGGYEEAFESYKSSRFRFASRNFYPEFLAARHVALNYEKYFGAIELDKPLETREVRMEGHAPVTKLSNSFEVDIHTIRMLNPALRQPIFNGQKYVPEGYALRLPSDGARILSTE